MPEYAITQSINVPIVSSNNDGLIPSGDFLALQDLLSKDTSFETEINEVKASVADVEEKIHNLAAGITTLAETTSILTSGLSDTAHKVHRHVIGDVDGLTEALAAVHHDPDPVVMDCGVVPVQVVRGTGVKITGGFVLVKEGTAVELPRVDSGRHGVTIKNLTPGPVAVLSPEGIEGKTAGGLLASGDAVVYRRDPETNHWIEW